MDLDTFHIKDTLSDGTSKMYVCMIMSEANNYIGVVLPVNVAAGHPRGPAQVCGSR